MAQAKLTPLAKILIATIIIGVASALVWNLGMKGMGGESAAPTASGSAATSGSPRSGLSGRKQLLLWSTPVGPSPPRVTPPNWPR